MKIKTISSKQKSNWIQWFYKSEFYDKEFIQRDKFFYNTHVKTIIFRNIIFTIHVQWISYLEREITDESCVTVCVTNEQTKQTIVI